MIFYNATTKQGICQEIDRLCDSDDTSYPRLDKTSRVNNALELVASWLIGSDGDWEWDDTNYTTKPRGVGTLVEGQESYSFASEYLTIRQIEVLNNSSPAVFIKIKPIQDIDLGSLSPEEYFGLESDGSPKKGFPQYYDKEGDTITLYPAPSATYCTLASGLRVWFQRTAQLFTAVSTTATDSTEPGFPSTHHTILAYMASLPYCMTYKKDRVVSYTNMIGDTDPPTGMKKGLLKIFNRRAKDEKSVITMESINFL
jgi:hypothetical protein